MIVGLKFLQDGNSALMIASALAFKSIVLKLLDAGADVTTVNEVGTRLEHFIISK